MCCRGYYEQCIALKTGIHFCSLMESSVINHTERSNELAFIQDFPDLEIIFVICVYFYTYLQCLKLKMTCRNRADRFFLTCTFIKVTIIPISQALLTQSPLRDCDFALSMSLYSAFCQIWLPRISSISSLAEVGSRKNEDNIARGHLSRSFCIAFGDLTSVDYFKSQLAQVSYTIHQENPFQKPKS